MKRTYAILAAAGLAACAPVGPDTVLPSSGAAPRTTRIETLSGAYEVTTHTPADPLRHEIDVAPARAWQALPLVYAELELPGTVIDADGWTFGFLRERMPRRVGDVSLSALVNCGSGITGPNALSYAVTLDVVTLVRAEGAGSVIETRIQGTAKPRSVSGNPVRCATTGALELYIAERVRTLAAGG